MVVLLLILPVHEFAHAYTSVKLGDETPRLGGRLTLNPFAHLDLFGSMALLLLGFGWAKPVTVDARNFKKPRRDMALTAIAGPMANILMALVSLAVFKLIFVVTGGRTAISGAGLQVIGFIVTISLNLAVFNLLPVPPLDGSKVLGFFLPEKIYALFIRYERIITFALFALIWLDLLNTPIIFLSDKIFTFLDMITPPFNMFVYQGNAA